MHALDLLLAIIAVVLIFTGIKRGLIGEIIRLAAMITGCFVAFLYYHQLAGNAPIRHLPVQLPIKNGIAFILIYAACVLAIIAIGWVIKKAVHLTPLGLIDRLAGGAIGFLKALLISYVVCLAISSLPIKRIRSDFKNSVVFSVYRSLPETLSLKSLLKKKEKISTIITKKPSPPKEIKEINRKFDTFKAVVDSAKKAQSSK
jgi:uncharacterized membrane protein required for colicin V production